MATRTQTTSTKTTGANKAKNAAVKNAAALVAPAAPVNPFAVAMAQVAKRGAAQAAKAAQGVTSTANAPAVGSVAPVGVATRNAGKAATMAGFALVGVNGRKQPLASSVTAAIWQAALAHQLANNGAMPTQAHIKLACPTVNPTSCGLGLTQYKAYTGQTKGAQALTVAQLQALAVVAPVAPVAVPAVTSASVASSTTPFAVSLAFTFPPASTYALTAF